MTSDRETDCAVVSGTSILARIDTHIAISLSTDKLHVNRDGVLIKCILNKFFFYIKTVPYLLEPRAPIPSNPCRASHLPPLLLHAAQLSPSRNTRTPPKPHLLPAPSLPKTHATPAARSLSAGTPHAPLYLTRFSLSQSIASCPKLLHGVAAPITPCHTTSPRHNTHAFHFPAEPVTAEAHKRAIFTPFFVSRHFLSSALTHDAISTASPKSAPPFLFRPAETPEPEPRLVAILQPHDNKLLRRFFLRLSSTRIPHLLNPRRNPSSASPALC